MICNGFTGQPGHISIVAYVIRWILGNAPGHNGDKHVVRLVQASGQKFPRLGDGISWVYAGFAVCIGKRVTDHAGPKMIVG